jgi:hypothetical protein
MRSEVSIKYDSPQKTTSVRDLFGNLSESSQAAYLLEEGIDNQGRRYLVLKVVLKEDIDEKQHD